MLFTNVPPQIEDIVVDVVRGVRTPPRQVTARARQRAQFEAANQDAAPFFTPQLYDALAALRRTALSAAVSAASQRSGGKDGVLEVGEGVPQAPSGAAAEAEAAGADAASGVDAEVAGTASDGVGGLSRSQSGS